jgi:hypothetical protein
VAVDVEISLVAVPTLADVIGKPADGENVRGAVEREGIVGGETLVRKDLLFDRTEAEVVSLEGMASRSGHNS